MDNSLLHSGLLLSFGQGNDERFKESVRRLGRREAKVLGDAGKEKERREATDSRLFVLLIVARASSIFHFPCFFYSPPTPPPLRSLAISPLKELLQRRELNNGF